MTDSVVAEGQVKLRDGKKWKSRWLVLRKPSPVADCLLMLVFKDKSEKSKGHKERNSVTLEDICGLEPGLSLEGVNHVLAIICLGQTVLLGFENKEIMCAWDIRTRYSLGEVHRFHVTVLPGTKLESGPATLHFCNNIFVLVRDVPPTIIGQWKLSDMRRYGAIPNGFVFEGGSRCGMWAGVFFLSCTEGEQISFLFDCIVRGISPTKGTFGLQPVLPDPGMSPAYTEERISHEALELEKRLSLLSHSSRQSSGGDDRSLSSSTESSDTSQSDSASIGSRLTLWPEQLVVSGLQEGHSPAAARGLGPAEEKLYPEVVKGSKPPPKPPRSRKLQEVGRQSSSDSGIATASHSSYSGSFSSYTGSLDVCPSDEFGSLLSLPAALPAERALCTCRPGEAPRTSASEYQVPSSLRHHYDTPRSVLQAAAAREVSAPTASLPSALKDQAPAPQEMGDSQLLGTERGKSTPPAQEGARDSADELYADFVPRWSPFKPQPPEAKGSEGASLIGTTVLGEGYTDPCEICSPYPGAGRSLFTACLTCGGLKGTTVSQSGALSIPAVPGSGSDSKGKARSDNLYGLTEPQNNKYKELQRTAKNNSQTTVKRDGRRQSSDGDIYGALWETRSWCLKGTEACRLSVTAPSNDSGAKDNAFSSSHPTGDRLKAASDGFTACGVTIDEGFRAGRETFTWGRLSGGRLCRGEGHGGGRDGVGPVYEPMVAARNSIPARGETVNSNCRHGPFQNHWRNRESARDTYKVVNAPRKLLAALGKVQTFPGSRDAVAHRSAARVSSLTFAAQTYLVIQAPAQEPGAPESCKLGGDCWRWKAMDRKSGKSSTGLPRRQQADAEQNWLDQQLSNSWRGIQELVERNGIRLKAEVCDRSGVDEGPSLSLKSARSAVCFTPKDAEVEVTLRNIQRVVEVAGLGGAVEEALIVPSSPEYPEKVLLAQATLDCIKCQPQGVELQSDKKPKKKEEKQKMATGQMYEFMEALPTEKQSELEKGSGYEYMASCGQQKLLLEGEGPSGSLKLHRGQGAHLDIMGLKQKREKGFLPSEDETSGSFDTKKLPGGAFVYPVEPSGADRSRCEGATYVNIPVSPASKKQLHYMELELQESSPAIRGAGSSKYAQIDITATETAHKVGTQHAQYREERLQELEQKRKGTAPQ
ncbi:uncharacterized protein dok7b [Heptranchias perlo]|uniref:uncharacterized protein dok7b n=1 Tax=Heptranchias perlo TaxID=212740 RepID=UPI003559F9F1